MSPLPPLTPGLGGRASSRAAQGKADPSSGRITATDNRKMLQDKTRDAASSIADGPHLIRQNAVWGTAENDHGNQAHPILQSDDPSTGLPHADDREGGRQTRYDGDQLHLSERYLRHFTILNNGGSAGRAIHRPMRGSRGRSPSQSWRCRMQGRNTVEACRSPTAAPGRSYTPLS
jgi:hypothetical protein